MRSGGDALAACAGPEASVVAGLRTQAFRVVGGLGFRV